MRARIRTSAAVGSAILCSFGCARILGLDEVTSDESFDASALDVSTDVAALDALPNTDAREAVDSGACKGRVAFDFDDGIIRADLIEVSPAGIKGTAMLAQADVPTPGGAQKMSGLVVTQEMGAKGTTAIHFDTAAIADGGVDGCGIRCDFDYYFSARPEASAMMTAIAGTTTYSIFQTEEGVFVQIGGFGTSTPFAQLTNNRVSKVNFIFGKNQAMSGKVDGMPFTLPPSPANPFPTSFRIGIERSTASTAAAAFIDNIVCTAQP